MEERDLNLDLEFGEALKICPLCQIKIEDLLKLEVHASSCNGVQPKPKPKAKPKSKSNLKRNKPSNSKQPSIFNSQNFFKPNTKSSLTDETINEELIICSDDEFKPQSKIITSILDDQAKYLQAYIEDLEEKSYNKIVNDQIKENKILARLENEQINLTKNISKTEYNEMNKDIAFNFNFGSKLLAPNIFLESEGYLNLKLRYGCKESSKYLEERRKDFYKQWVKCFNVLESEDVMHNIEKEAEKDDNDNIVNGNENKDTEHAKNEIDEVENNELEKVDLNLEPKIGKTIWHLSNLDNTTNRYYSNFVLKFMDA